MQLKRDALIAIDLALHAPGDLTPVLAIVADVNPYVAEILIADDNNHLCSFSMPLNNFEAPAHYRITSIADDANQFAQANPERYSSILEQDLASRHGRLTIIRAIHEATADKCAASEALARSISISTLCRTWIRQIEESVTQ